MKSENGTRQTSIVASCLIVWSSNYDRKSSRISVLTRAYFLRIEKLLGFLLGCQYFDSAPGFEITEPPWTCEKARASSPFPTTEKCVRLEDMSWVSIYVIIKCSNSEDLFQFSLASCRQSKYDIHASLIETLKRRPCARSIHKGSGSRWPMSNASCAWCSRSAKSMNEGFQEERERWRGRIV